MKSILCTLLLTGGVAVAGASSAAITDPFYTYTGVTPLSSIPAGTVLNQRTVTYNLVGFPTPLKAIQVLYRTNNAQKQAVANVTTILVSPTSNGKAISYQSFYDSLNPSDAPSQVIAGNGDITSLNMGNVIAGFESLPIAAMVKAGYDVIVPDTEGQTANFAAGPEYGMTTLDSIRAALQITATGLNPSSKVAMIGYSGGGIATNWAAQLAPTYAPDVNRLLVGASYGGLLVNPISNLSYVNGSVVWAGVAPMAMVGLARAYNFSLTPYVTSYGQQVVNDIQHQGIAYILLHYPTLQWAKMFQPQYANDINGIPQVVAALNKVNAGLTGSPTIPLLVAQGTTGVVDGNFSLQPGDGVMPARDTRALMQKFCASGTNVQYLEFPAEHFSTAVAWAPLMLTWINDRFAGKSAPNNCGLINLLPSNSLAAQTVH